MAGQRHGDDIHMGFDTMYGQNGHVYDFSKLEKDVVTTIRHLSHANARTGQRRLTFRTQWTAAS
jgi:hypothetical protein